MSRTVKYSPLNIDYEQSLLPGEVYRVIEKKSVTLSTQMVKPYYLIPHSHKKLGKMFREKYVCDKK